MMADMIVLTGRSEVECYEGMKYKRQRPCPLTIYSINNSDYCLVALRSCLAHVWDSGEHHPTQFTPEERVCSMVKEHCVTDCCIYSIAATAVMTESQRKLPLLLWCHLAKTTRIQASSLLLCSASTRQQCKLPHLPPRWSMAICVCCLSW